MPLPSPKGGQNKGEFVSSCMSNETMIKEFPNEKQRAAVCYSKYKQSIKNSRGNQFQWNDSEVDDNPFIFY